MTKENNPEEQEYKDVNSISVGDLTITSTTDSMKMCVDTAKDIITHPGLKEYLGVQVPKKKMLGI